MCVPTATMIHMIHITLILVAILILTTIILTPDYQYSYCDYRRNVLFLFSFLLNPLNPKP